jgi:hypothetical protein
MMEDVYHNIVARYIGESPDSCLANFESSSVSSTSLRRHFVAQPWNNHNKNPFPSVGILVTIMIPVFNIQTQIVVLILLIIHNDAGPI